ncbi:hypothetical protein AB656_03945 [Bifidobacterium actinocoloniiforme DSM 22766]|nr:hypothetical protein AB656_03945 [Bifidobacterium actinocoloniiforme DSM 22766]
MRFYSGLASPPEKTGIMIAKDGVEGWLSTPPVKLSLTERAWGNGAHDVSNPDITYAARTVTIHLDAVGMTRSTIIGLASRLNSMMGKIVKFRVIDDGQDTYVEGYLHSEYGSNWSRQLLEGTLTLVCPRPERLSWDAQSVQLMAPSVSAGGLSYGPDGKGLAYPLDYGAASVDQSQALLRNRGTARAYPVLTASGDWPDGVLLVWDGGESLEWRGRVWPGVPLVLDCRSRTASMGGVDVSRGLTRRGFPRIEPGGDIMLRCLSAGGGWVDAQTRDTYI